MGESLTDGFLTTTVEEVARDLPYEGATYSGALVKNCIDKMPPQFTSLAFSWAAWAMTGPDGSRYASKWIGTSVKQPMYPNGTQDGSYGVGDCVRGWMFFDAPTGAQVAFVRYQAADMREAQTWRVP